MVKILAFSKSKTVAEIFEEAGVKINPALVGMQETSDGYVFYLPDDAPEEEIAKLEQYFSKKGLKRNNHAEVLLQKHKMLFENKLAYDDASRPPPLSDSPGV